MWLPFQQIRDWDCERSSLASLPWEVGGGGADFKSVLKFYSKKVLSWARTRS